MKILFEGSPLLRKTDGVGRYSKEIFKRIGEDGEIVCFIDDSEFGYKNKFIKIPLPRRLYNFLYKYIYQIPVNIFIKDKPDVVVYFNFVKSPLIKNIPTILVIHDLAYLHAPDFISKKNLKYLQKFVMKSIEESDKIIAVSEYTKDDLINTLSVEKDKVIVANNAINSEDFKNITQSSVKSTLNKFKVEGKFLLFVGTLEPRKNIKNIILAFEKLADPTITLVLAGKIGWLPKNELEYLNKITNKNSKVVVTGYISDDDLRCLYIGAEMLLFPSNFEGFGLPILEAMASGTPVITSNLRPMNEIAGNAAILVKPDDILEISQSIKRILTDTTLSNQLIRRGYKNVEKYNWEKSADVFKQVIKDLR